MNAKSPRQIVADACDKLGIVGQVRQRGAVVDVWLRRADELDRLPDFVESVRTYPRIEHYAPKAAADAD